MPKLRVLSGKEVVHILESLGFSVINQKGSHIKMRRVSDEVRQTLTIPNHRELDRGTTKAIYHQALHYVSEEELRGHFFTK